MVDRAGFEPAYGKPGQIYSLLPLTTRPPVHGRLVRRRLNGEWERACQRIRGERRGEFPPACKGGGIPTHGPVYRGGNFSTEGEISLPRMPLPAKPRPSDPFEYPVED